MVMKLSKSYILLVCTWLLFGGLIIYLRFVKGLEPPTALLILLVIVALIPLAGRLKIGDWFDFTRKVEGLSKEVSSTKKELREIRNMLTVNIRGQQQFNISLQNEETARAFAESMSLKSEAQYPPSSTQEDEDAFFSEKMSPIDKQRFFFIKVVDEAIASAKPILEILYDARLAKQQKDVLPQRKWARDKDLLSIIEELQTDWSDTIAVAKDEAPKYLESIKTLITVRHDVAEMTKNPPSVKEVRQLLRDAGYARGYLFGILVAGFGFFLVITSPHRPNIAP
jgi:hypothetical protein